MKRNVGSDADPNGSPKRRKILSDSDIMTKVKIELFQAYFQGFTKDLLQLVVGYATDFESWCHGMSQVFKNNDVKKFKELVSPVYEPIMFQLGGWVACLEHLLHYIRSPEMEKEVTQLMGVQSLNELEPYYVNEPLLEGFFDSDVKLIEEPDRKAFEYIMSHYDDSRSFYQSMFDILQTFDTFVIEYWKSKGVRLKIDGNRLHLDFMSHFPFVEQLGSIKEIKHLRLTGPENSYVRSFLVHFFRICPEIIASSIAPFSLLELYDDSPNDCIENVAQMYRKAFLPHLTVRSFWNERVSTNDFLCILQKQMKYHNVSNFQYLTEQERFRQIFLHSNRKELESVNVSFSQIPLHKKEACTFCRTCYDICLTFFKHTTQPEVMFVFRYQLFVNDNPMQLQAHLSDHFLVLREWMKAPYRPDPSFFPNMIHQCSLAQLTVVINFAIKHQAFSFLKSVYDQLVYEDNRFAKWEQLRTNICASSFVLPELQKRWCYIVRKLGHIQATNVHLVLRELVPESEIKNGISACNFCTMMQSCPISLISIIVSFFGGPNEFWKLKQIQWIQFLFLRSLGLRYEEADTSESSSEEVKQLFKRTGNMDEQLFPADEMQRLHFLVQYLTQQIIVTKDGSSHRLWDLLPCHKAIQASLTKTYSSFKSWFRSVPLLTLSS
jgi:hypothetical protein